MPLGAQILVNALISIPNGIGSEVISNAPGAPGSSTWPANNRAFYLPIYLPYPGVVTKLWVANGAAVSGNIDVGLYSEVAGVPAARLASAGGVAQSGTSVIQEFDITDYVTTPQTRYFVGVSMDNTTGAFTRVITTATVKRIAGVMQEESAYPLPASATPVVAATGTVPFCGVAFRALVA